MRKLNGEVLVSIFLLFSAISPFYIYAGELPKKWKGTDFSGGTVDGTEVDASNNVVLSKNLIPNPGFEIQGTGASTDADAWSEGSYFTRLSDRVHNGSYSIRADVRANTSQTTVSTNNVSVTPGCTYKLSGYVYRDGKYTGNAYLDMSDVSGEATVYFSSSGAWTYNSANFVNSSQTGIKIRLVHDSITATGSVWWDDVRLENSSVNEYTTSGTFTSSAFECDTTTTFGNLYYEADIPSGCSVTFKTRSASTVAGLTGTFDLAGYATTSSGQFEITSNPDKCIQWQAIFKSSNSSVAPTIKQVSIYPAVRSILSGTSPVIKGNSSVSFTLDFDVAMTTTIPCTIAIVPVSGNRINFTGTWSGNTRFVSQSKQISSVGGGFATLNVYGGQTQSKKVLYFSSPSIIYIDSENLTSSKLSFFPDPFSPNGDGKCEAANLFLTYSNSTQVKVNIYDLKGILVRKLFDDYITGNKSILWNGTDDYGKSCPIGIYIFQVRAGTEIKSGTVVLTK